MLDPLAVHLRVMETSIHGISRPRAGHGDYLWVSTTVVPMFLARR